MIYFVACDDPQGQGGFLKIGYAKNVERRLAELQVGCPYPLRLVKSIEGCQGIETTIQSQLYKHHIRGEWYRMNNDVLSWIDKQVDQFADLVAMGVVTMSSKRGGKKRH